MSEVLFTKLNFPEACVLGNRVYKKLFLENANAGAAEKRALKDDVEVITWTQKLSPETTGIPALINDEREYTEIAVLTVAMTKQKNVSRIAQLIHRCIPYPVLLVFQHGGGEEPGSEAVCLSLAHKRFSQSEKDKIVADEFFATGWLEIESLAGAEREFIDSLRFSELPKQDLFSTYASLVDRMIALDCAKYSGSYAIGEADSEYKNRAQILADCQELEQQLAALRKEIKQETQFNRRVELNVEIKKLSVALKERASLL